MENLQKIDTVEFVLSSLLPFRGYYYSKLTVPDWSGWTIEWKGYHFLALLFWLFCFEIFLRLN